MMTSPLLLATAAWVWRPPNFFLHGFRVASCSKSIRSGTTAVQRPAQQSVRRFATDPSQPLASLVDSSVSRLSTLQTLLQRHGAPGSQGCQQPNDLIPIVTPITARMETPELMASLEPTPDSSSSSNHKFINLHPYLFPICQSASTGHIICAYRDPRRERDDSSSSSTSSTSLLPPPPPKPWPIVEAKVGGPGMQILALNSEHLLRRMVCEMDFAGTDPDLVALYNQGLGQNRWTDAALDTPYVPGSVAQLGYGVDKYVLLKVGPFADLYEQMARQHYQRGDEASALIAAETSNGKLSGFASTFRFYARLLSSFPHREEEVRDAARMCLRLSLPTIGMHIADLEEVATLANLSSDCDTPETALQKLGDHYRLIQSVEKDDDKIVKNPTELALDEASALINDTVLLQNEWSSIRPQLAQIFRSIDREDMATFVNF